MNDDLPATKNFSESLTLKKIIAALVNDDLPAWSEKFFTNRDLIIFRRDNRFVRSRNVRSIRRSARRSLASNNRGSKYFPAQLASPR